MASRKMQLNLNIEELPNVVAWIADLTAARDAAVARADAAETALVKAYEHAAHQAGVAQFASKKAWLRQMQLCRAGQAA